MDRRVATLVILGLLVPVSLLAQKQTRLAFVSVDRAGAPVPNLTAADFAVSVGGVKQPVTRVTFNPPMRIVLLADASSAVAPMLTTFRQSLGAFIDALPPEIEVALISMAGQIGVRQAPTTDHALLHTAIDRFASQGGANSFLDILLEADKRFLKNAPDRWPVFVIVTTDSGEMTGSPSLEQFNTFTQEFRVRGGSAHAMIIHGTNSGLVTDLADNLVKNTGGAEDVMAVANPLPEKLKALAARLAGERQTMVNRYAVEYTADAKSTQPVEVKVAQEGITIQVSPRRPF